MLASDTSGNSTKRAVFFKSVRNITVKCLFFTSFFSFFVLFLFFLFSVLVNEKVWELVTYCVGALLDCVYILNYY